MFSSNETKEDIATSDLKYVLAPFYLGEVVARTRTPDPSSRLPVVTEAAECHELFLSSCEQHELLSEGHVAARAREAPPDPATARAEKVGRFKREKAIRTRLDELDLTRRKRRVRGTVALTPGCQICYMDYTGCHRAVTHGCQIGYIDRAGCHQLNRVLTAKNNV